MITIKQNPNSTQSKSFHTTITANGDTPDLWMFKIVRDSKGKVLVFQSEKITKLNKGKTYNSKLSYKTKGKHTVIVYDLLPHEKGSKVLEKKVKS